MALAAVYLRLYDSHGLRGRVADIPIGIANRWVDGVKWPRNRSLFSHERLTLRLNYITVGSLSQILPRPEAAAELAVFRDLHTEYEKNRHLVRQRIHMETFEETVGNVGQLRFVAPRTRVIVSD